MTDLRLKRAGMGAVCATLLLFIATAAAAAQPAAQAAQQEVGMASYYAEEFHGKRTANGERFSMWAMTAAHQTLPFNTLVRVTNLSNSKTVVVRINDAGPFKDERIIDLSKAAAARLGMVKKGKTMVRLEVVGEAPSVAGDHVSRNDYYRIDVTRSALRGYGIQVGSFADLDKLLKRLNELERKNIGSLYVQIAAGGEKTLHRLVVGSFETRGQAEAHLRAMSRKGVTGFVFQVR